MSYYQTALKGIKTEVRQADLFPAETYRKRGNPNFKAIWSSPTKVVRIPEKYIARVKSLCFQWENSASSDNTASTVESESVMSESGSSVAEIPVASIACDPQRFQFKLLSDSKTGSSGSLKGIASWNPDLAGLILVWRDPNDSKIYVINGHNRLALANKLGIEKIAVRFINASTAKQARLIGALANIAEGKGTAIDAAKLIRDSGLSPRDLKQYGVKLTDSLASYGVKIANLADHLFDKVFLGDLDIASASAIGSLEDKADQQKLYELIRNYRGNLTQDVLAELADSVKASQKVESSAVTLFGTETISESLAIERAQLQSYIIANFKKRSRLFGLASSEKNTKILEKGSNKLNPSANKEQSDLASTMLEAFNRLKNVTGSVSEILNYGAKRLKNGEKLQKVREDCLRSVENELSKPQLLA
jgi:ParB-like chromosome segregation protein Spo0J